MTDTMLTWIGTAYLLAAAMFWVPFGKYADIHGRKRIYTIGIIIDTIATGLGTLLPSGTILIIIRFLQGLGDAMIFGTEYSDSYNGVPRRNTLRRPWASALVPILVSRADQSSADL